MNQRYATMTGQQIRELCRSGAFASPTCGAAVGMTQANLAILPARLAGDFERFCRLNPKPCPLLEVTEPGQFEPVRLALGADLRTDLPRYRVHQQGVCVDRPTSIESYWRNDFVAFLIGCSFTFESALLEAGIPLRHLEQGRNVPMYRTNVACAAAGPFAGPLVVSMRPMTLTQAEQAVAITARFEQVHGAPVHIGDPAAIGIDDLSRVDYGDAIDVWPGEVPVFWACGVTPMEAIMRARPTIAITHEPGHMFVTDVTDESLHDSTAPRP